MVWLGIDLGDARVGLALSDPGITLAYPAGNIQVYGDSFRALDEVVDVIEDELVDHVIVGLPLLAKARRRHGGGLLILREDCVPRWRMTNTR